MSDTELSRRLTALVRAAEGVTAVYPAQPLLEAAAGVVAETLELRPAGSSVDIERADGVATVRVQIAAADALPAPDTLRRVGELLRRATDAEPSLAPPVVIAVAVRLVDTEPPAR
ncbi:hypothetical protein NVV95_14270 [Herbiconiux sp. CPCC 205716]|uniref:Uncharacterized protein n=1 Tax=Herbiconiux gentiana TaxID=2970912 RepID=A0ABT2GJD2_9MICO|nr:hypothetical protein [Herbiconiux gentiana]MCS5715712.1 hypothetical protein [Herbiconiux gentiana]